MQVILGAPLCCKQAAVSECHSHRRLFRSSRRAVSTFGASGFTHGFRGLFGAPRAVCSVQCVHLLVVVLTGDDKRWLRT